MKRLPHPMVHRGQAGNPLQRAETKCGGHHARHADQVPGGIGRKRADFPHPVQHYPAQGGIRPNGAGKGAAAHAECAVPLGVKQDGARKYDDLRGRK